MWFHIGEKEVSNVAEENQEDKKIENSHITGECLVKVLNLTHILPEDRDDRRWYIKLCIKRCSLPKYRYSSISKAWLDDYISMMGEENE